MTQLEKMLLAQLKELTEQFNQQSIRSNQQFEVLAVRLRETNQRLENMTENYQNLQSQLMQLSRTEAELLKELRL